jgi:hypothetical protein
MDETLTNLVRRFSENISNYAWLLSEIFLGVKAAGAWGWQPHHLHVSNVMEIWEPKAPGTLRTTPGLLQDSFTFPFYWVKFASICLGLREI